MSYSFGKLKKYLPLLRPVQAEKFTNVIDKFDAALNDQIDMYNAEYKDMYSYVLTRQLEEIWDHIQKSSNYFQDDQDLNFATFGVPSINKWLKMFNKGDRRSKYSMAADFLDNLKGLPEAIKEIKSKVKSGRKPSESESSKPMVPMASVQANKKAAEFLGKAINPYKEKYFNSYRNRLMIDVQRMQTNYDGTTEQDVRKLARQRKISPDELQMILRYSKLQHQRDDQGKMQSVHKFGDVQKLVDKYAREATNDIVEQFIFKGTAKLAKIFERKAEIKAFKVVDVKFSGYIFENTLSFEFADGSSFVVYTSTVFSYSKNGKPFVRFPTRFTNVRMADGSMMKTPSEIKMKKEF